MVVATNLVAINDKLKFRKALTPGIDPAPTSRGWAAAGDRGAGRSVGEELWLEC